MESVEGITSTREERKDARGRKGLRRETNGEKQR